MDLGHPSKVGLLNETNHVRLLQHACASHVWALWLEFLSAKKFMHKTQSIRRLPHTHTEAGIWGVAYRTASMVQGLSESLSRCILARHSKIYISPQFCMSPYTWSFVILGIACIPSYSAAPLQTALYQPEFMFGNFQVWPTSVVAQCNPLTGLVWIQ